MPDFMLGGPGGLRAILEGDVEFTYSKEPENVKVTGMDTTIFSIPNFALQEDVIDVAELGRFCRFLVNQQAKDLGETIHHAEFVVTRDPAVIEARGIMHDCEACRTAVRQAIRRLDEDPRPLVVGNLYWRQQ